LPRGHLLALNRSFRRTLDAEYKSSRTVEAYTDAVRLLATYSPPTAIRSSPASFAASTSRPSSPTNSPVEAGHRPQPLSQPARLLQVGPAEGDLAASPMDGMRPPQLPEQPVGVVRAEQLTRLLKTCEGRDFTSRRDTAIILLLVDTGMRRAECVGMTLDDVDLDQRIVWVLGKGRRPRALPIGRKTIQAVDRYLRAREGHRLAHRPQLWVGRDGPVTPSGVYQVVHDRPGPPGCRP
jgi:integrase/recombinase XerC